MPLPTKFANLGISLKWVDGVAVMPVGDMQVRYYPPAYTSSLDAALALVEEVLPGWDWSRDVDGSFYLWSGGDVLTPREIHQKRLANDALTCDAALLRALIAKQEVGDAEG